MRAAAKAGTPEPISYVEACAPQFPRARSGDLHADRLAAECPGGDQDQAVGSELGTAPANVAVVCRPSLSPRSCNQLSAKECEHEHEPHASLSAQDERAPRYKHKVATLRKNSMERLDITLEEYNGCDLVNLAVVRDSTGHHSLNRMKHTARYVSVSARLLPQLIEALQQAESRAGLGDLTKKDLQS